MIPVQMKIFSFSLTHLQRKTLHASCTREKKRQHGVEGMKQIGIFYYLPINEENVSQGIGIPLKICQA